MLQALAEAQGVSGSDYVRLMLRREFEKRPAAKRGRSHEPSGENDVQKVFAAYAAQAKKATTKRR